MFIQFRKCYNLISSSYSKIKLKRSWKKVISKNEKAYKNNSFLIEYTFLAMRVQGQLWDELNIRWIFANFKPLGFSKSGYSIIFASFEVMHFFKVWRLCLKNYPCHALLKFETVLAENPFWLLVEAYVY